MAGASLFTLLDDIATLLRDAAASTSSGRNEYFTGASPAG